MKTHGVYISLFTFLAVLLCTSATRAEEKKVSDSNEESVATGKVIYKKQCQMCHGEKGMGDGPAGRLLNPKPMNLTDKEKMEKLNDASLFGAITKGDGPMPPFERKLSEADRWHVVHFVRTFAAGSSK
jgi:mono/diheme cytochrome c family protein